MFSRPLCWLLEAAAETLPGGLTETLSCTEKASLIGLRCDPDGGQSSAQLVA